MTAARKTPATEPAPRMPTDRQLQLLRFIVAYEDEHGAPPTLAEMLAELGVAAGNKGAAQAHLRGLRAKGLVLAPTVPGASRGWRASPSGRAMVGSTRRCPHCSGVLP